jgi:isopentenyldiphosphate isomerase
MEYIDLYDEKMNPLNKTIPRNKMRNQKDFFFIVHIWIQNAKGEYLIQKRNKKTDNTPFMWATTMGVVESKKTSLEAAIQEVREELGLHYQKKDFTHIARYKTSSSYANHFTDVFVIHDEINIEDVIVQESELIEVKFVSKKTLNDMINTGTFWNYKKMLQVSEYFTDLEKSEQR